MELSDKALKNLIVLACQRLSGESQTFSVDAMVELWSDIKSAQDYLASRKDRPVSAAQENA
jgi:hypothetical protein